MFKKLADRIKGLSSYQVDFDPASFNDLVAMQTKWTPARGGGASFRTHTLVQVDARRIEFRASLGAWVFSLIFLLVGSGITIGIIFTGLTKGSFAVAMSTILPLFVGIVFAVAGCALLYFGTAPIVFDDRNKVFWKGRKNPHTVANKNALKYFAEFDQIHALQLLSEFCSGNKSSYYSYELNLVLKNGERITVVDHGNKKKLRQDAETLAGLLNIPVWDAI